MVRVYSKDFPPLLEEDVVDFLENTPTPIHWVDGNGRIVYANKAELEFMGYSEKEYIGSSIASYHLDKELIVEILERLKSGETLINTQVDLCTKDGSVKHVVFNTNGLFRDGKFIHTRCI